MAGTPYDLSTAIEAETPQEASRPYETRAGAAGRESEAPSGRNLGEHVFIWVAWALAAAFWGATLTTLVGILRAAAATRTTVSMLGASGGSAYLALVVTAFALMALALAYGSLRSASRSTRPGEFGAAALYDAMERQGGEDFANQNPDARRVNRESL
jgi:hypothetical protein